MSRLSGKICIITGAAGGIGEVIAKIFAQEGSKVVLTDINDKVIDKIRAHIVSAGFEAIAVGYDVSS